MGKLLILKTGNTVPSLREKGEDFEDWIIARSGLPAEDFTTIEVFRGELLPDPADFAGIYVTGSPAYVTDLEPWSEASAGFLRQALAQCIPILGICYGHQLLAHCAGGRVGFHPGGREIGTVAVTLTDAGHSDVLLSGMAPVFPAQVSHQQSVLALPDDAILLAFNDFDPHQAFRLGNSAWGLQFHPEFSVEVMRAYLRERRDTLLEEGLDPYLLDRQVTATGQAARLISRFADIAGNSPGASPRPRAV